MTSDIPQLKADVCNLIAHGGPDAAFNDLALRLFRWHLAEIPRYRNFCQDSVGDLAAIDDYRKIPPLPVDAFKYAELCCTPADRIVHRFSTSGTSQRRGPARRGTSAFDRDSLEIMDKAIQTNAKTYLFPDGERCRIFVLAPRPTDAPHMIMAHGMRHLMSVFGDGESDFFAGNNGLDTERLLAAIEKACQERVPVCLIGASFGFVHLLDTMAALGKPSISLVRGSRLMDAGGYKGKSRELTPDTFRELVAKAFDLPDAAIVNLLGMTELSSQIYDSSLASGFHERKDARRKLTPPWFRTRVANVDDPSVDATPGEVGLLVHYDLANFSRPFALMSDDLGRSVQNGFHILSRVKSSEPRGCSVSVDELWRQA